MLKITIEIDTKKSFNSIVISGEMSGTLDAAMAIVSLETVKNKLLSDMKEHSIEVKK